MSVLPTSRNKKQGQSVRRSAVRRAGPTKPGGAVKGYMYYDTDYNLLFVYNGVNWDPVSPPVYSMFLASGSGSTDSESFADWPGSIDLNFTKYATHTKLAIVGSASLYATTVDTMVATALQVDGIDYPVGKFFFKIVDRHLLTGIGGAFASGLAAGLYTARLRWRSVTGGTINADGNDVINYQLQETV